MENKECLRMKKELIEEGRAFLHTEAGNVYIRKEDVEKEEAPTYAKRWAKVYKLTMILYLSGTDAEMVGITYTSERELKHGDFEELYQEMVGDIIDDLREAIYAESKVW